MNFKTPTITVAEAQRLIESFELVAHQFEAPASAIDAVRTAWMRAYEAGYVAASHSVQVIPEADAAGRLVDAIDKLTGVVKGIHEDLARGSLTLKVDPRG